MLCDSLAFSSCLSICRDYPSFVVSCIAAFGTLLASIIALVGRDEIARFFVRSKMNIKIQELNVHRVTSQNVSVRYFYLYLDNKTSRIERNVRVYLRGVSRGTFDNFNVYPIPLQIVWSPAEQISPIIDVNQGQTLDFMRLEPDATGKSKFLLRPLFYVTPNDFEDNLRPGEHLRFKLEIVADYYRKEQVFDVEFRSIPSHTLIADVGSDVVIKKV
ncbi:hypothetical protein [uncultured Fibrobacter sp.]|uniref:hypothetical protein n=1 Tax=uncultured Fibrobacter sp. TaxID=261512 RepID=UPI00261B9886|nr:hypothetical protein [uncultured Fibrobacter sp.]